MRHLHHTGVCISYIYIISAMLRCHSSKGRHKAFSTCASHLIVFAIFFDQVISVLYIMVSPTIYSMRTKEY
nr:PREDICTED: olfactory receptor 5P3-like [Struthio camelus australis]